MTDPPNTASPWLVRDRDGDVWERRPSSGSWRCLGEKPSVAARELQYLTYREVTDVFGPLEVFEPRSAGGAEAVDALRTALEQVRELAGGVCADHPDCGHPACRASHLAWTVAEAALRAYPADPRPSASLADDPALLDAAAAQLAMSFGRPYEPRDPETLRGPAGAVLRAVETVLRDRKGEG